jgi:hypothetical protein
MARGAQAFSNANQSITNNTITALTFTGVNFDTDVFWSAGSNTRLTVPGGLGGQYVISAQVNWAVNVAGYREIAIIKNGATFLGVVILGPEAAGQSDLSITVLATLVAGDFVQAQVLQTSGGALNSVAAATYAPSLAMSFMGN